MGVRRDLVIQQMKLAEQAYQAGVNIVTCGHCGAVLLHSRGAENIHCFSCLRVMDLSDCPDFWYEGAQDSQEFENDNVTT